MPSSSSIKLLGILLITSCLALAQQPAPATAAPAGKTAGQERPQAGKPAGKVEEKAPPAPAAAPPALPEDPKGTAWEILEAGSKADKLSERATAIRVLGLMTKNVHAEKIAGAALNDEKPEIRAAGASALGEMQAQSSIPKLTEALSDADISVALAAAHALDAMHDPSAFQLYYEILTGERKTSKSSVAEQTKALKDPKKLAMLGFEEAIGFVPFAGIGWEAYRRLNSSKNDSTPVRTAAAKVLARDPDPASARALADATKDNKNWLVRAAALEAIAQRGDPSLLKTAELAMSDDEAAVKYTAAATVVHLIDVQEMSKLPSKKKRTPLGGQPTQPPK
jgi:HEAT repeat protein